MHAWDNRGPEIEVLFLRRAPNLRFDSHDVGLSLKKGGIELEDF